MTQEASPTYEFEIRDKSGLSWEVRCSARTEDVYEISTEVESGTDPAFAKYAKISAKQAIDIAKARFGGTAAEIEYEIKFDGSPSYQIDLNQPGRGEDHQYKVDVDAVTGKITGFAVEEWQIGIEDDEEL